MSLTITVGGVDITDKVRPEGIRLTQQAVQGQVGTGQLLIDDATGAAELATPGKEWSVTDSEATPTTIAGGFVGEYDVDRGPLRAGTARQFGPVLEDWNTVLTDRVLKGDSSRRPAETDYERISWLVGQSVLGMLDGAGQVPNTNTSDMPKTNYRGKTPLDVLDDCAESSNKNFFVYFESGTGWVLYYDKTGSTDSAFTSSLQISDDPADIDNSTVFGASSIDWQVDPERIYSGLFVKYDGGSVWVPRDATATEYRSLQRTVVKKNFTKGLKARAWANRQLDKLNEPTKRLSLTVAVPSSALGQLRAGMRIEVKLRSRSITAFTYFRIVSAEMTRRGGADGVSDVEWNVRLTMRDKVRPVNLDDDYGGGDSSGNEGTGGNNGGGGGAGEGGGAEDPTPYVLDDFDRSAAGGAIESHGGEDSGDTYNSLSPSQTSIILELPDGSDVVGRFLLMNVSWRTSGDGPTTELEALGMTKMLSTPTSVTDGPITYSANWFYRFIDGTEGFTGTDDTLEFTPSESLLTVVSAVELLSGVYDDSGPTWSLNPGTTADPDSLSADGYSSSEDVRYFTSLISDDSAISGDPTGYDNVGASFVGGLIAIRMSAKNGTNVTEDPSAYTCTGPEISYTLRLRGGAPLDGWGSILEGGGVDTDAPWEGGNEWQIELSDMTATVSSATGATLTATADDAEGQAYVGSSAGGNGTGPSGPWNDAGVTLWRFKVDPLGDLADSGPNSLTFVTSWDEGWQGAVRINLGDDVTYDYGATGKRGMVLFQQGQFISATGTSSFLEYALAADTEYYLRIDTRDRFRARLWPVSGSEPVDWSLDIAKVYDTDGGTDAFGVIFLANDGMVATFRSVAVEQGRGFSVLPPGDGSTTTWTIEEWVPGTLRVFVDGIQTIPASFDRSAGTFTFDRAPALGAVIRVEYVAA